MRNRVSSGAGELKTPSSWRRLAALIVVAVCLMVALVLPFRTTSPALAIVIVVSLALLIPAWSLERRGRVPWLSPALTSAMFAACLAWEWRGSDTGLARTVWIAILAFLSATSALVAVVEAVHPSKRGGGQGRRPEPPAGNPGSLT
jgi:hypothetical protein